MAPCPALRPFFSPLETSQNARARPAAVCVNPLPGTRMCRPMHQQTDMSRMQQLFDLVSIAAESPAEPPDSCHREICALMEQITPTDLGLHPSPSQGKKPNGPCVIRTQSVYESPAFDIVVFLFPAGATIPLHDHPGMTVFSKVLYGKLGMRSFDWLEPPTRGELDKWSHEQDRMDAGTGAPHSGSADRRPARRRGETVLTPEAPTFLLRPRFCNIHAFEATGECAVLDVLLPPYDDETGRDCHYFEAALPEEPQQPDVAMLSLTPAPPGLVIRNAAYNGPAVGSRGVDSH